MNFYELKQVIHSGNPEVHVLSNQGDLYLVQIFNDGSQSLLTQKDAQRPVVFHSLPECYETLSSLGLRDAYVDQIMEQDEMINLGGDPGMHMAHQKVIFYPSA